MALHGDNLNKCNLPSLCDEFGIISSQTALSPRFEWVYGYVIQVMRVYRVYI